MAGLEAHVGAFRIDDGRALAQEGRLEYVDEDEIFVGL